MNPEKMTVSEFVEELDGSGFKASPNRHAIKILEVE